MSKVLFSFAVYFTFTAMAMAGATQIQTSKEILKNAKSVILLEPSTASNGEPSYFMLVEKSDLRVYSGSARAAFELEIASMVQEPYGKSREKIRRTVIKFPNSRELSYFQSGNKLAPFDVSLHTPDGNLPLKVVTNKAKVKKIGEEAFYRVRVLKQAKVKNLSVNLDFATEVLADPKHPLHEWVINAAKKVVLLPPAGSGVVLGRDTKSGEVLMLSALHVGRYNHESLKEGINNWQSKLLLGAGLFSTESKGPNIPAKVKVIFSPGQPQGEEMDQVNPARDFLVSRLELSQSTDLNIPPIEIGKAQAGETLLLLGYPRMTGQMLWHSVGQVIDNNKASELIARTKAPAFDPAVEIMVEASAIEGMSGGGAFDQSGRLVGILVRQGGDDAQGKNYTRIVRADYIAEQLMIGMKNSLPAGVVEDLQNLRVGRKLFCPELF